LNLNGTTKLGVLFLGRERPGFDVQWGSEIERRVEEFLGSSPYETVSQKAVNNSSLREALALYREEGCDALVALQPTMSDGRLAPILAQQWGSPLILWATPERPEGPRISSNSLVGTHIFASTLRQLRRPFEIVYGDPSETRVRDELHEAVQVSITARYLKHTKLGLVGYHAPGFIDMHADPFDLNSALGVQMHHFGLQELLDSSRALSEEAVREDVAKVLGMGLPFEDITAEDLPTNSRLYLAMRQMIEEESLDALAIREWPELPNILGQWPYLAIVRLTMEVCPTAMEGDVDGAISCLVGQMLGLGPAYLSDWLEHDRETITLWHMGNAPLEMCEPTGSQYGPRLAKHFNIPKPIVVNANLKADQPVTLFRLWRCDGRYLMMAQDAETEAPKRHLMGTNGLVRIKDRNVYEWFDELCHAGMPHHVAVFRGHHQKLLRRFARQANVERVDGVTQAPVAS
jgi:L-fucose isomerase-like protein